jgi:hypothetical protein
LRTPQASRSAPTPLEGGEIFEIGCRLHPPHRTATLVVMPER